MQAQGEDSQPGVVKVNEPLRVHGTDVYLLGNGYAPTITVRDPDGEVVFTDAVPFLPQDANLTSIGVVKVPDGLEEQLGMVGFFYPTQTTLGPGAYTSSYPDLVFPVLTLNVYQGDLGIDGGEPTSVYTLDPSSMEQLTAARPASSRSSSCPARRSSCRTASARSPSRMCRRSRWGPDSGEGDYSQSVSRFASFDIHDDPSQGWVLVFAVLIIAGLLVSLFVPRRRMWVKAVRRPDGAVVLEYAGLARGEDPGLEDAVASFADRHAGTATDAAAATPAPGRAAGESADDRPNPST